MEYRALGRSGLKASRICLGAMMFGAQTDEPTAQRIAGHARDAGVNFIDTADTYGGGMSEEVTGRLIANDRNSWVLATKVFNPGGPSPNERGLSRKWIFQAIDASLRRLGTDHIDIYYLHKEDYDTPLEETVHAVADLIRQGKVRYFGVSNHRSWRLAEICRLCDDAHTSRPVASQPYYNAVNRMPEAEHLPACSHFGVGVVPYSPLARGVLTGKYVPGASPLEGSRAGRGDARMLETEWRPESLVIAQELKNHAAGRGITAAQFAFAWVLNNTLVSSVIAGPRTEDQWLDYLGALRYSFTVEDEAFIDRLVPSGHPSTPGYNDPMLRLEGRIPGR